MNPVPIQIVARLPVPVTLMFPDGTTETYNLPYLGVRGLLPWLAEQTEVRHAAARKAIEAARLVSIDKFNAENMIARDEAIMSDLVEPAQTPKGIERILSLSIERSDVPKEKRALVLDAILGEAFTASNLAQRLSTLFRMEPDPAPQTTPGGPNGAPVDPLAGRGSETPATSAPESATTT